MLRVIYVRYVSVRVCVVELEHDSQHLLVQKAVDPSLIIVLSDYT